MGPRLLKPGFRNSDASTNISASTAHKSYVAIKEKRRLTHASIKNFLALVLVLASLINTRLNPFIAKSKS